MMEYEYSKVVEDLKKYISYCESNGYILEKKSLQERTLYRNENGTIARITINDNNDKELDFKEDKMPDQELIVRKESLPIKFTDDEVVNSILDILNYKKDNTLKRYRYVYTKDNVKFELDEYLEPEKKCVAAIEGDKELVDIIWKEIN